MIVSLRGALEAAGPGFAVIDVGGVGLRALIPASTSARLPQIGGQARLFTFLHVQEGEQPGLPPYLRQARGRRGGDQGAQPHPADVDHGEPRSGGLERSPQRDDHRLWQRLVAGGWIARGGGGGVLGVLDGGTLRGAGIDGGRTAISVADQGSAAC